MPLRKVTKFAIVWISICLMSADPAAACRLLAGRRCCCCPCGPSSCGPDGSFGTIETPIVETAPSGTATGVPESAPLTPAYGESFTANPPLITPTSPHQPATSEPFIPPPSRTITNRQPLEIYPPVAAGIEPPAGGSTVGGAQRPAIDLPAAGPAGLTARQGLEAAIGTLPAARESHGLSPVPANIDPVSPGAHPKHVAESPPSAAAAPAATGHSKLPAEPAIVRPANPIAPPAFAPVDDDPFAPLAPAANAPRTTPPTEDDPFAPIKPPAAPQPKATPPIAAEPTLKLNDPLQPGIDGRLPVRQWTDNSGQFRATARLVLILDGKVRLLKETGRTTTVPTERLSAADQQYVAQIIARYGHDLTALDQFAAR